MNNPFIFGGPVPPEDFYGRDDTIHFLMDRLFGHSRSSVALWGDRRVGKSSLLYYLTQPDLRAEWTINPDKHHVIFVDCQALTAQFSQQTFWDEVLDQGIDLFVDADLQASARAMVTAGEQSSRSWRRFFRKMQVAGESVTLFLDEFSSLVVAGLSDNRREIEGLLATLRAMITTVLPAPASPYPRPLAVVTSTRRPLDEVCQPVYAGRDAGSPFHNPFVFERLKPFSLADIDSLLQARLSRTAVQFDEAQLVQLLRMAGRHPILVQSYASTLYEAYVDQDGADIDLSKVDTAFAGRTQHHFQAFWQYSSPFEQELLGTLVRTRPDWNSLSANQENARRQLVDRGLLTVDHTLFSPLFEEWLQLNLAQLEANPTTTLDARSLLPLLDNRFNDSEMRELCFELQMDYENLPGSTRREKARSLIEWAERHGRLPELVSLIKRLRPDLS